MNLDRETKDYLRAEVDRRARKRAASGYMDCDPESLTQRAQEAYDLGHVEVGDALRNFRDHVVNVLLGEGWTVERIELAMWKSFRGDDA